MKIILILIVPFFLYAENLKSIIEYAMQNSDLVISKKYTQQSKSKQVESKEGAYYPTLDIGAFYQSLEQKTPNLAGDVYSGYATLGYDIYDGGKRSALLRGSKKEYEASSHNTKSMKNSLALNIVNNFFNIKSLDATLSARYEAKIFLQKQLERVKRFVLARVATQDDVDRLQAAYDTNIYEMEAIKLEMLSMKKLLELKIGRDIDSLDDSEFIEFREDELELIDSVKSLMASREAVLSGAKSLDSIYYPRIKIEDTYSMYGYNRTDHEHKDGFNNQNKLLLSFNMRIYDNAIELNAKEALEIEAQALNSKLAYSKKEQLMQYEIALSRIKTSLVKIKSSTSALKSADSAFRVISKKYDAGIVDNVVYLDALSSKTTAKALYEKSLNDLEVAYASYYYYGGKNIEEFLRWQEFKV